MRRAGVIDTAGGLGQHDHLCWVFDTRQDYRATVQRFLADGLAGGQRVVLVADWAGHDDLARLAGLAGPDSPPGAAQLRDVGAYGGGSLTDPAAQVRTYAAMTEQAVADGFSGLRVAADVTPLVRSPEARAAFARYEFLADGYMARHPMSAMCGYDRAELGAAAVAELAGMHPLASPDATALRLFAADPGDTAAAAVLAGEIDIAGHAQLRAALSRVDLAPVGGTVSIDARQLTFIDHTALIALVEHVRGRGAATELLVDRRSGVPQLAGLLRLADLRVVVA
ncbi:MEDS domain-containing protein [Dactylosporangium aurantiacum]|uniref:MEDS domain-containing protein n=1 Tax=Dactylosporangium aurantiacum TaxID=35754 RepID=A0A9Q9ILP5_9ACTN|nr:MEDS domain-containing protein [Dactylosporangium aurantiacum]MDG6105854.1 MEDS domain-containing protein [Dactylosporangium aurantiacum]UWZ57966.1 MEDS domain-containing protein [Dactylosporangium aurantiacum]